MVSTGSRSAVGLFFVALLGTSRAQQPQAAAATFVASVVLPRVADDLDCFLEIPFVEVIAHAQAQKRMGMLDVESTTALQEFLYSSIVAASDPSSESFASQAIAEVFVGLETGQFVGYTWDRHTLIIRGSSSGLASEASWAPYSLLAADVELDALGPGDGAIVRSNCPGLRDNCGRSAGCCDRDVRTVFATSESSRGMAERLVGWDAPYDPRERPWYTACQERFQRTGDMLAWSPVYTGTYLGTPVITAMGAIVDLNDDAGHFRGVIGVDYRLESLSEILASTVNTQVEGSVWCFICIRTGELAGTILGNSSTAAVDTTMMMAAAQRLADDGWQPQSFNGTATGSDGKQQRYEATAIPFHMRQARGLDWLVVAGQQRDCLQGEVWQFGRCVRCPSGTENRVSTDLCEPCGPRHAGSDGTCALCSDGTQPNIDNTACVTCTEGTAGRGGSCDQRCDNQHAISSADRTECVCPVGTYDSQPDADRSESTTELVAAGALSAFRIFCWRTDRKVETDPSNPRFGTVLYAEDDLNNPSVQDLDAQSRCVACPSCVSCNMSGTITVNSGYAAAFSAQEQEVNLYKCPPDSSCLASSLNTSSMETIQDGSLGSGRLAAAASMCENGFRGTLCSACADTFYMSHGTCKECSRNPILSFIAACVGFVAVALGARWSIRHLVSKQQKDQAEFWMRVVEKSWPRLKQSFQILVTNMQITTGIAQACNLIWPSSFGKLLHMMSTWVNADLFKLPGLACLMPTSYYSKWTAKMAFLPCSLGFIYIYHRYQVHKLVKKNSALMAAMPDTDSPDHTKRLAHKLQLTVQLGHKMTQAAEVAFMLVYIAWPSISKACFQLFKCRRFDGGIFLLTADLSLFCTDSSGVYTDEYHFFHTLAIISVLLIPIGVPLGLGIWLYKNGETVKRNPEYVTLVFLKPIFMFYKPNKYLFEIFVMGEKVILIGLMGLWETSTTQKAAQVLISTCSLACIAINMPSKTQQYNWANLLSRLLIIVTFLSTIVLESDRDPSGSTSARVELVLLVLQLVMFVFLVYISTNKLLLMIRTSKEQVKVEIQLESLSESDPSHGLDAAHENMSEDPRIRMAFRFFDKDGSLGIKPDEIADVTKMMGQELTAEEKQLLHQAAVKPGDEALLADLRKKNFNELWRLGEQCGIDQHKAMDAAEQDGSKGCLIKELIEHFIGELVDSRFCAIWLGEPASSQLRNDAPRDNGSFTSENPVAV